MKLPRGLVKRSLLPSAEACSKAGVDAEKRRKLRNLMKARRKARKDPAPPQATSVDE